MSVNGIGATGNVVHIIPDALFSIYDAKTGESANVYRADDYSEKNPVYLVKGMDKNGNEYEQTGHISATISSAPAGRHFPKNIALQSEKPSR